MRLARTLGTAAIAALGALALLGAGTAAGESTALCEVHEEPCAESNLITLLRVDNKEGTVVEVLSNISTVLCLDVNTHFNIIGSSLGAGIGIWALIILMQFYNCGTNSTHTNCSLTKLENPIVKLSKTALNLGELSVAAEQPGVINLQCTILGFPVNCDYSGKELTFPVEGAEHTEGAGNGRLVANKTPANEIEALDGLFCPSNAALDGELVSLDPVYITG